MIAPQKTGLGPICGLGVACGTIDAILRAHENFLPRKRPLGPQVERADAILWHPHIGGDVAALADIEQCYAAGRHSVQTGSPPPVAHPFGVHLVSDHRRRLYELEDDGGC